MRFLQLRIDESVPDEQKIEGVAVDLDSPLTPEAIAILQELGASLQNNNPFDHPPTSDDRGRQTSGKAMILCPIIC